MNKVKNFHALVNKINWLQYLYPDGVLEFCIGPNSTPTAVRIPQDVCDDLAAEARITNTVSREVTRLRIAGGLLDAKNDSARARLKHARARILRWRMKQAVLMSENDLHSQITAMTEHAHQLSNKDAIDEILVEISVFEIELAIRDLEREARNKGLERGSSDALINVYEETPPSIFAYPSAKEKYLHAYREANFLKPE